MDLEGPSPFGAELLTISAGYSGAKIVEAVAQVVPDGLNEKGRMSCLQFLSILQGDVGEVFVRIAKMMKDEHGDNWKHETDILMQTAVESGYEKMVKDGIVQRDGDDVMYDESRFEGAWATFLEEYVQSVIAPIIERTVTVRQGARAKLQTA